MIVLQSPAIAKKASHRPCHSPSPGVGRAPSRTMFGASPNAPFPVFAAGRLQTMLPKTIPPSLSKAAPVSSKAIQGSLMFFARLSKAIANISQVCPRLPKPIQGIFQEKRIVYYLPPRLVRHSPKGDDGSPDDGKRPIHRKNAKFTKRTHFEKSEAIVNQSSAKYRVILAQKNEPKYQIQLQIVS